MPHDAHKTGITCLTFVVPVGGTESGLVLHLNAASIMALSIAGSLSDSRSFFPAAVKRLNNSFLIFKF